MAEAYRILWVAPDKQIQLHLLKSIETAEFDITTATDCMSAMGQVKNGGIDLVLLMAGIEGFAMSDICRVLKSLTPDKFLPTVLLSTGSEDEGKPSSADEAGADDYMTLPLQPGEFRARVRALMHTKVLQDQLAESKNQLKMSLQREHSLMAELREDNRQLKVRSITDGLTCLYNHRYFTEWLKMEFKISR
ncbi:MAG: hypothetical protein QF662_01015, partial [Phycisphaerae bacterium]|nr:hypothetical protein [Phycisphaerae bacterium]